jgi:hypothetical protein
MELALHHSRPDDAVVHPDQRLVVPLVHYRLGQGCNVDELKRAECLVEVDRVDMRKETEGRARHPALRQMTCDASVYARAAPDRELFGPPAISPVSSSIVVLRCKPTQVR